MSNSNKVLLIGPTPPPMGGIARYCDDIMNSHLKEKFSILFHDITIPFSYRPKSYTKKTNSNILFRDGLSNVIKQVVFSLKNFREFNSKLVSNKISIVHIISCTGLGFWRNAFFVIISKRKKIKVLWHIVGEIDVFYNNGNLLKKYFITNVLNKSDVIVVQSEGLKVVTQKMTSSNVISIYNGVNTDDFKNSKGYSCSNKQKVHFVTLGVLGKRKGYFDLISIATQLKKDKINHIKFYFIGGGQVDMFRSLIISKGLEKYINVVGQVSDEDKIRILHDSDVFVLPTYAEGQPIALLEGLSAGLPIISTTVGSIPEVIKEKNGMLIEPGDINSLKEHILKFSISKEMRRKMGTLNMIEANEKYSLERVIKEIDFAYLKLLSSI